MGRGTLRESLAVRSQAAVRRLQLSADPLDGTSEGMRVIFHVVFASTVVGALLHLWRERGAGLSAGRVVEVSLLYLLCVQWGFGAVLTSVPHIVVPDQIAASIGWAPGSPFQVELGFASLGTSLVGILCIWHRGWFWLALNRPGFAGGSIL